MRPLTHRALACRIFWIVVQNFNNILLAVQENLFKDLGVEEADVDYATHYYMRQEDKEVLNIVQDFRQLYSNFGGEVELDLPADLDEKKMIAAFEDYVAAREQAQEAIMKQLNQIKSNGGQMNELQQQQIGLQLQQAAAALIAGALKKHDLTELVFQAAMKKFIAESPAFKAKVDQDKQRQLQHRVKRQLLRQIPPLSRCVS